MIELFFVVFKIISIYNLLQRQYSKLFTSLVNENNRFNKPVRVADALNESATSESNFEISQNIKPIQTQGICRSNGYLLKRPRTPSPDIQNIISEIKNPKDLISAVEGYKPRSKYINIGFLSNQDNTKIKRYKDCLYFGQVVDGKRHGKGNKPYQNTLFLSYIIIHLQGS